MYNIGELVKARRFRTMADPYRPAPILALAVIIGKEVYEEVEVNGLPSTTQYQIVFIEGGDISPPMWYSEYELVVVP